MDLRELHRRNPEAENSIAQVAALAAAFGKTVLVICYDGRDADRQFRVAAHHAKELHELERSWAESCVIDCRLGGRIYFRPRTSERAMRGLKVDLILTSDY